MKLFIKKLNEMATIPTRATNGSAGYDLSACIDAPITISPNEIVKIPTGISVTLEDENLVILIYARSSLATKFGITLANCVGVVDSDYRGEILVALTNLSGKSYEISPNERIAQMIITPVFLPEIEVVEKLSETIRGEGGFGSTGKM